MLAKWAACPASCMRVVRAVCPDPTAAGSASEVKWVSAGWNSPLGLTQAGCGQWQKPLEYLPLRSSRSRSIVAPLYWIPSREKLLPHISTAFSKGKKGVHACSDIPTHHESSVPRLERRLPLLVRKPLPCRHHDVPRPLLQRVQDLKQPVLPEPLRLSDLVIVIVRVPQALCHCIAGLDDVDKPLFEDKWADGPETLVHRLAHPLFLVGAHARAEAHARHLHKALPGDGGAELHCVALRLKAALNLHRHLPQRARLGVFHDVAPEGALKHLEYLGLLLGGGTRCQELAGLVELLLVREEGLHRSLGARELLSVEGRGDGAVGELCTVAESHLGAPELSLKSLVDLLIPAVDRVDELLRLGGRAGGGGGSLRGAPPEPAHHDGGAEERSVRDGRGARACSGEGAEGSGGEERSGAGEAPRGGKEAESDNHHLDLHLL
mmetsp:Transcript_33260/g.77815  ORF Transcript_33260/g.77815 Transcript_33260/m.77815 type:complete len:436 (-) Transcript_33260:40-1347(-)